MVAPKSPSGMCACSCHGCSAKAKSGYIPDVLDNNLQERSGTFALVLYPGQKSLYTKSGCVHGCQEDTYVCLEDIFASGARDFFASGERHFLIWGVRSTQIFVSRGVFT